MCICVVSIKLAIGILLTTCTTQSFILNLCYNLQSIVCHSSINTVGAAVKTVPVNAVTVVATVPLLAILQKHAMVAQWKTVRPKK